MLMFIFNIFVFWGLLEIVLSFNMEVEKISDLLWVMFVLMIKFG